MTDPDSERNKLYVEIWKRAIETQMHFNEMSVKSRQLGLTFVAAALGLSVVLLSRKEDFSFTVGKIELHVSVVSRERALSEAARSVQPDCVLEHSFSEIIGALHSCTRMDAPLGT